MLKHPSVLVLGFVFGTFFGTAIACAGTSGVRDNGDFFSDSAKKEATRRISEIESQFKKELVVETFTAVPEEIKRGVDLTDKPALKKMFNEWTLKEAKNQKVNGIYILISREPAHLQIVVGGDTLSKAFTLKDRDSLTTLMLSRLRAKQNDEALSECVKFVSTTMSGHASPGSTVNSATSSTASSSVRASRTEQATPWGWIITAVIGIAAVWLIVGVLRSFMGGRGATAGSGMMPGGGGGGGGMFNSLLGGMFGAAAGMWLYDQFSGSHGNAWGSDQENRGTGSTGFSGQDTDYSGTGGDFGGDYSGGDSGGSDGGGGDF